MARYQVTLAYDGTRFFGFQRQRKTRTVQGVVEAALQRLGWQGESILAAGRTDTGVHASGQVIAFDLNWRHGEQSLQNALNANLPADVSALMVQVAADSFHPRYDACSRTYQYRLICRPVRHPLLERFAWRVWPAPALERLQAASRDLPGRHDFAAFGRPPVQGGSTIRQIFRAEWRAEPEDGLLFTLSGNAFLYRMVRRIVALLVSIGQGNTPPDALRRRLEPPREPVQGLAPPRGLTLTQVEYPS